MKVASRYILIAFVAFGFAITIAQTNTSVKNLGAVQIGNFIRVTWKSSLENGVDHYEVYRSTEASGTFADCIQDNIRCKGDNQSYSLDDTRDLFKTTGKVFFYKIKVVGAGGIILSETSPVVTSFNSTSSAAKRTWGSIKAMFR
jgi:hypothetical protein